MTTRDGRTLAAQSSRPRWDADNAARPGELAQKAIRLLGRAFGDTAREIHIAIHKLGAGSRPREVGLLMRATAAH